MDFEVDVDLLWMELHFSSLEDVVCSVNFCSLTIME